MANQKPIAEVRTGAIKAAMWKNSVENGSLFNVMFDRLYEDGDKWKSTSTFGRDDLLLLAKVADLAATRIFQLQLEDPPAE